MCPVSDIEVGFIWTFFLRKSFPLCRDGTGKRGSEEEGSGRKVSRGSGNFPQA